MRPLKLFAIHDSEEIECQVNVLVWCHSERYARQKMRVAYYRESGEWPDAECEAKWTFEEVTDRIPAELFPAKRKGERRDKVARLAGWMEEGDRQCENCELYEFGGDHPVCEDCCLCDECGCKCEKAEAA